MIQLYRYGKPFETDTILQKPEVRPEGTLPYFKTEKDGRSFSCPLKAETAVYGLGETVRGINKRGWLYVSNCTDEPAHTEGKHSLYAAHNFLLIADAHSFGVFFDYPGELTFDIGYTDLNMLRVSAREPADMDVYLVEGDGPEDIVRQFRGLIGRSYIAPKWAFGYGQSRWSYYTADEVREVVRRHRENHIPLDSVYLDIDYMERYKDFTVNRETFPDFPGFVQEMKKQKIHLVPIIDAGVKIENGYDVYEEGIKNGYFCKKEDGTPFVGAVWPGKAHFPDFLDARAREWFGGKYKCLLDQGIDGFWNDMNEPAIFYSEDRLNRAFAEIKKLEGRNLDVKKYNDLLGLINDLSNNPEDYASFYHVCNGKRVRHDRVHNLYGYHMTRAAGEAFEKLEPEKRILMFSRSSCIGMHRYGGVWTGDNRSWWSHLLMEIQMMPSLNMCGFLYSGADIGGFGDDATADLLLRWIAFGLFTPLMRNHATLGTREQEVYRFPEALPAFRNLIRIRYALLPYLYSEYMKAALRDGMYFKPLAFVYPDDPDAIHVQDQLMIGDELMIAPVYVQNAAGRSVYLPEPMKLVRMRSPKDFSEENLEKGHHYLPVPLDETIFFIRADRCIPLSEAGESVEEIDFGSLALLGNVQTKAVYQYYSDDGYGKDYDNPSHYATITMDREENVTAEGKMPLRLAVFAHH